MGMTHRKTCLAGSAQRIRRRYRTELCCSAAVICFGMKISIIVSVLDVLVFHLNRRVVVYTEVAELRMLWELLFLTRDRLGMGESGLQG